MKIEEEIFLNTKLNKQSLISYGFIKNNDDYSYCKTIMNNNFLVCILINDKEIVTGKIWDLQSDEEYTAFRIKNSSNTYANIVRTEYENILNDIKSKCFILQNFTLDQANRIARIIEEKYQVEIEFLWEKFPHYGVFRDKRSKKWFAIIMDIDKSKLQENESGATTIINVNLNKYSEHYLSFKGIYSGYHLNKKNWVSIALDDTLNDTKVLDLVNISYDASCIRGEWIVPANPRYYDVIDAFNYNEVITWKTIKNIYIGDTVYIYLTKPICAILFKCIVIEKNNKLMKIKLIEKYDDKLYTLKTLNDCGVVGVKSIRGITKELSEVIKEKFS